MRALHDENVGCNIVEHITAFLYFWLAVFFLISASPPEVTDIKLYSVEMYSFGISWESRDACQSTKKVTGYKIVYQHLTHQRILDETNATITIDRDTTNYTIAGLERNKTYCVRILAYNENGDGYLSDCTEVTTTTGNVIGGSLLTSLFTFLLICIEPFYMTN